MAPRHQTTAQWLLLTSVLGHLCVCVCARRNMPQQHATCWWPASLGTCMQNTTQEQSNIGTEASDRASHRW
eukprot:1160447-Pelagomonas_calceolata.AAC.9